jgi:uncharacterized protein YprB with RNaseH-like and TPR domain
MLRNTFCHVPGIGLKSERRLWSSGILSWRDVSGAHATTGLPLTEAGKKQLKTSIDQSMVHVKNENPGFFAQLLHNDQHWRMFPDFRKTVAYLDIETTGLGNPRDYITTVALYDGTSVFTYINGKNLDEFKRDILKYKIIVTYNGKCFDVPFIRNFFRVEMNQAHIDLRYVLRSLGYSGGLKGCEKQLGLDRAELEGVDGFFAVLLWDDYRRSGNVKSLETLLAYNIEDVVNLETLMVMAYNMKVRETPFDQSHKLAMPSYPSIPFKADMRTIERIRQYWTPSSQY